MNDVEYMMEALKEAVAAYERGETPVGAVFVKDEKIISRAGNEEHAKYDPTAHAEILCLRRAGSILNRHIFPDCTMYTTLWPCPMCDNAMLQAQVPRVASGARTFSWITDIRFNKGNMLREGPIMEEECRSIFVEWIKKNNRYEILEYDGL